MLVMFASKGYFSSLDCPYFIIELNCIRPYCQYFHPDTVSKYNKDPRTMAARVGIVPNIHFRRIIDECRAKAGDLTSPIGFDYEPIPGEETGNKTFLQYSYTKCYDSADEVMDNYRSLISRKIIDPSETISDKLIRRVRSSKQPHTNVSLSRSSVPAYVEKRRLENDTQYADIAPKRIRTTPQFSPEEGIDPVEESLKFLESDDSSSLGPESIHHMNLRFQPSGPSSSLNPGTSYGVSTHFSVKPSKLYSKSSKHDVGGDVEQRSDDSRSKSAHGKPPSHSKMKAEESRKYSKSSSSHSRKDRSTNHHDSKHSSESSHSESKLSSNHSHKDSNSKHSSNDKESSSKHLKSSSRESNSTGSSHRDSNSKHRSKSVSKDVSKSESGHSSSSKLSESSKHSSKRESSKSRSSRERSSSVTSKHEEPSKSTNSSHSNRSQLKESSSKDRQRKSSSSDKRRNKGDDSSHDNLSSKKSKIREKSNSPDSKTVIPEESVIISDSSEGSDEQNPHRTQSSGDDKPAAKVRIAHVPNVSSFLNAKQRMNQVTIKKSSGNDKQSDAKKRPTVTVIADSCIPLNVRQSAVNNLYEELVKFLEPEQASENSLSAEIDILQKVENVKSYKNHIALLVLKIRKSNGLIECK